MVNKIYNALWCGTDPLDGSGGTTAHWSHVDPYPNGEEVIQLDVQVNWDTTIDESVPLFYFQGANDRHSAGLLIQFDPNYIEGRTNYHFRIMLTFDPDSRGGSFSVTASAPDVNSPWQKWDNDANKWYLDLSQDKLQAGIYQAIDIVIPFFVHYDPPASPPETGQKDASSTTTSKVPRVHDPYVRVTRPPN